MLKPVSSAHSGQGSPIIERRGSSSPCYDKCQKVAIAFFLLAGVATIACGVIFSLKPVLAVGIVVTVGAIASSIFKFYSNRGTSASPRLTDSKDSGRQATRVTQKEDSESTTQLKNDKSVARQLHKPEFWNGLLATKMADVLSQLDWDDVKSQIPFKALNKQAQINFYNTLKANSSVTPEQKQLFWKKFITVDLIKEMSEQEIARYYGQMVVWHFTIHLCEWPLVEETSWKDLEVYHEKILRSILKHFAEAKSGSTIHFFVSHMVKYIQYIHFEDTAKPKAELLYGVLKEINFDFSKFFQETAYVHDFTQSDPNLVHLTYFTDTLTLSDSAQRISRFKTLFDGRNAVSFIIKTLSPATSSYCESFKTYLAEIVSVLSSDTLTYLKIDRLEKSIEKPFLDALRQYPVQAFTYYRQNCSVSLIAHMTEEEIGKYYDGAVSTCWNGSKDEKFRVLKVGLSEILWSDIKEQNLDQKVLKSVVAHGTISEWMQNRLKGLIKET